MISAACAVMRCSLPAELYWSTGESEAEYTDWNVCRAHHRRLRSGEDFATHSDLPNSADQWLLMGQDLEDRQTDAMQASSVTFEYTGSGKEMEIEVTTGKGKFDVILDQDQATELGDAVADMTDGGAVVPELDGEPARDQPLDDPMTESLPS
jgi:hypothetical protein